MKKAVIVSGYFNPIHKGHLELFTSAREHGDELWVVVNNDKQRALKGSKEFMYEDERLAIVQAIRFVDRVFLSIDKDKTQNSTLQYLSDVAEKNKYNLAFANGGDQTNDSIPEAETCRQLGIELIDNLGKKIQSSSWLLAKN